LLDNSLGEADYYDERDYIGILRRLVVYAIDACVLLTRYFAMGFALAYPRVLRGNTVAGNVAQLEPLVDARQGAC